nr:hypothetical protein Iba_chr06aCG15810 [Ipomoea batatas]
MEEDGAPNFEGNNDAAKQYDGHGSNEVACDEEICQGDDEEIIPDCDETIRPYLGQLSTETKEKETSAPQRERVAK